MSGKGLIIFFIFTAGITSLIPLSANDPSDTQKLAAREFCQSLAKIPVHKLYVANFLDSSKKSSALGRYVAASYSKMLSDQTKEVTFVNRADAQTILDDNKWLDGDLLNPKTAKEFAAEAGVDAVVWGVIETGTTDYTVDLTVRDPSGRDLLHKSFEQPPTFKVQPVRSVPADELGPRPYFAGLDGVSQPKCKYCPAPGYSNKARSAGADGTVFFFVMITEAGKVEHIHVIHSIPELDQKAIAALNTWTMEPARDSHGSIVPAWVIVEVSFRL